MIKSKSMRKIKTVLRDGYTTVCLLHYQYFKQHYKLISVDLSKQEEFVYPKVIKQTKFYGMLRKFTSTHSLRKTKKKILEFHKGTAKVL